jgi:hypothetical protein
MPDFLKGNFETKNQVVSPEDDAESLNDRFEREALKRLGGSIAFVSKKGFVWTGEDDASSKAGD